MVSQSHMPVVDGRIAESILPPGSVRPGPGSVRPGPRSTLPPAPALEEGEYLVGTGIYDITGPAAEIVMMGFAVPKQKTSGIHLRLRSRAFIFGDAHRRAVFVSADLGMIFQMVKRKVAEKLANDPVLSRY